MPNVKGWRLPQYLNEKAAEGGEAGLMGGVDA